MDIRKVRYDGSHTFKISDFDTHQTGAFKDRAEADAQRETLIEQMFELQEKLMADNREGLLIVLQAMDAAGKDGIIRTVMTGLNPAGVSVHNFKTPTAEELDHDYLWRAMKVAPERGSIAIFNRSYYEDVIAVKVHNYHLGAPLPKRVLTDDIFERRYAQIRAYEQHLTQNGFRVLKIFLNISKEEQKKQLLQRIDDPSKNWKFSDSDVSDRAAWDRFMLAYEQAINATATKEAPWYVIPGDTKWYARVLVAEIVNETLKDMDPRYPEVTEARRQKLLEFRELLMRE